MLEALPEMNQIAPALSEVTEASLLPDHQRHSSDSMLFGATSSPASTSRLVRKMISFGFFTFISKDRQQNRNEKFLSVDSEVDLYIKIVLLLCVATPTSKETWVNR